jgi:hypothetical protein
MIPRVDYRIILGSSTQGLATYDHMRGLAIHAVPLNEGEPNAELGWGRLERLNNGILEERRSYIVTGSGVQDGPSPGAGSAAVWLASGSMAFPDQTHADNALAHAQALAEQGQAVVAVANLRWPDLASSTGAVHLCRHEDGLPCLPPYASFSIAFPVPDGINWAPGEAVVTGDVRRYEGISYVCLQGHTTQADWTPPATPSLWSPQ